MSAFFARVPWRRFVWLGIAGVGVAYEVSALNDETPGNTLSETTRLLFRTDTPQGRLVWYFTFGPLFAWLSAHIARKTIPNPGN